MNYQTTENGVCYTVGNARVYVPEDPLNSEWRTYQAWLAAGNTPLPAAGQSLEECRAAKNDEINAARLRANKSSFTHDGHVFACDDLSRGDIDGTAILLQMTGNFPQPWPGYWKAIDNSQYPITTPAQWNAFYTSMGAAGAANFAKSQQLKQQLAAATTIEQVNAITW